MRTNSAPRRGSRMTGCDEPVVRQGLYLGPEEQSEVGSAGAGGLGTGARAVRAAFFTKTAESVIRAFSAGHTLETWRFLSLAAKIVFLAVSLTGPAASQGRVEGHGAARRFISEKYRFSMSVPSGWGVSTGLDTPVFFYAPGSGRFVQDAIPQGGAVITVEPHDIVSGQGKLATTPEAWARADTRAFKSSNTPIEPFQFPKESGVSRAVICSYSEATYSPVRRRQHSVAIFWEFDHKLFAAHLNYNANDSNGGALEKAFLQAIPSFRPLDKRAFTRRNSR